VDAGTIARAMLDRRNDVIPIPHRDYLQMKNLQAWRRQ
jgi:hypothetical protein